MKLSDSMVSVNDSVTLNRYDNGYMLEVGGRDKEDEWVTKKIMCTTLEEVFTLITEYSKLKIT